MNANRKSAVRWAGASALSVLLATTSAFAAAPRGGRDQNGPDGQAKQSDSRFPNGRSNDRQAGPGRAIDSRGNTSAERPDRNDTHVTAGRNQSPAYGDQTRGRVNQPDGDRDNQRVNVSGRVTSFNRERDGYRVQLDRGGSYWIPAARLGSRSRDLRVGISLSLGGIFRSGAIGIDAVSWPEYAGYGNDQGQVRGVVAAVDYPSGVITIRDDASGRLLEVDLRDTSGAGRIGIQDVRRGDYVTLSGQWLGNNTFAAFRIDSTG